MNVQGEEGVKGLLKTNLIRWESPATEKLFEEIKGARVKGYLTKAEFLKICYWKSARAIRHVCKNEPEIIEGTTKDVFKVVFGERSKTKDIEVGIFKNLDGLKGVSVKMASAILTISDPENYGVLDTWVWQLLCCYGIFNRKNDGTWLTHDDCYEYEKNLRDWRDWARENIIDGESITARNIEKTLFLYALGGIPEGLYTDTDKMSPKLKSAIEGKICRKALNP